MVQKNLKEKPTGWTQIKVFIRNMFIVIGLLVLIIGAFFLGRLSMSPRFVSLIPKTSPSEQETSLTPEQATQQLFEAAQQGDDNRALSLCHPDLIKDDFYQIRDLMEDVPKILPQLKEVKILNMEETVTTFVSLVSKDGNSLDSGKLSFRKHQGQWLVVKLDL